MNINIDKEVRIKLNTNITNNSDSDKPEFIEFTREQLVYPNLNTQNMRKYPFLSDEFKYPEDILTKMIYQDRVNFFFSKRFLLRFLTTNPNIVKIDKADFAERDKTIEENVKIMLKLLFITLPPYMMFRLSSVPEQEFFNVLARLRITQQFVRNFYVRRNFLKPERVCAGACGGAAGHFSKRSSAFGA